MVHCPVCGRTTEGRNHNGRGWRCDWCWALTPPPIEEPPTPEPTATPEPAPAEAKRKRKVK